MVLKKLDIYRFWGAVAMDQEPQSTPILRKKWKVLDSKYIGRRLNLLAEDDSANAIKKTSYKIYTGLPEGTFKVHSDS
jgi:hypothetical protein